MCANISFHFDHFLLESEVRTYLMQFYEYGEILLFLSFKMRKAKTNLIPHFWKYSKKGPIFLEIFSIRRAKIAEISEEKMGNKWKN
jgi:hypothetical protein